MFDEATAEEIDVPTAHAMWRAGDLVVDVRLPEEYEAGHIAGAVNIPIRDLPVRQADLPDGQIITVCATGNRSRRAATMLAALGRTSCSLRGGTKAWAAAGHSVAVGPEPGERRRRPPWRRL